MQRWNRYLAPQGIAAGLLLLCGVWWSSHRLRPTSATMVQPRYTSTPVSLVAMEWGRPEKPTERIVRIRLPQAERTAYTPPGMLMSDKANAYGGLFPGMVRGKQATGALRSGRANEGEQRAVDPIELARWEHGSEGWRVDHRLPTGAGMAYGITASPNGGFAGYWKADRKRGKVAIWQADWVRKKRTRVTVVKGIAWHAPQLACADSGEIYFWQPPGHSAPLSTVYCWTPGGTRGIVGSFSQVLTSRHGAVGIAPWRKGVRTGFDFHDLNGQTSVPEHYELVYEGASWILAAPPVNRVAISEDGSWLAADIGDSWRRRVYGVWRRGQARPVHTGDWSSSQMLLGIEPSL